MPKNSHLALLLAIEADQFLDALEEHNFDIFDEAFRKKSLFKLPYAMYQGAKKGYYWENFITKIKERNTNLTPDQYLHAHKIDKY